MRLDVYRNMVYSEDSFKTAKEDKAALTKLKKALDTRRKKLTAIIDEPLAAIDGFVKDMEAKEKRQKRELIRDWYLCATDDNNAAFALLKRTLTVDEVVKKNTPRRRTKTLKHAQILRGRL